MYGHVQKRLCRHFFTNSIIFFLWSQEGSSCGRSCHTWSLGLVPHPPLTLCEQQFRDGFAAGGLAQYIRRPLLDVRPRHPLLYAQYPWFHGLKWWQAVSMETYRVLHHG